MIWGAAAMEGFFTDEEMDVVADYIAATFGRVPTRPDALTLCSQAEVVAGLIAEFLIEEADDDFVVIEALQRFVSLCAHCGVGFRVYDKKGRPLTSFGKYSMNRQAEDKTYRCEPYSDEPD